MASKYTPHNGNVVVRAAKRKETVGGIALPDGYDGIKPMRGAVMAVSVPWQFDTGAPISSRLSVGDRVLYDVMGTLVEDHDDHVVEIISEEDVLAVETEEETK